ncbi:MAG TPA: hypothetical protein VIL55_12165 [Naasia sp.]|jgi:uncharacterized protein (DUF58 family)
MRRVWPALLLMLAVGLTLAWLALGADGALAWGVYALWFGIAVALLVRLIAGISRRRAERTVPARAIGSVGLVQAPPSRLEVRPDLEPAVYGPDTSPITMIPPEARNPFEQHFEAGDDRRS